MVREKVPFNLLFKELQMDGRLGKCRYSSYTFSYYRRKGHMVFGNMSIDLPTENH